MRDYDSMSSGGSSHRRFVGEVMVLKYVLLDMNTQRDFLDPAGSCPVGNLATLVPKLRKVFALARAYHMPVISALDTHRETEPPKGLPWHCLEGSPGQKKMPFTLLQNRVLVEANNSLDLPLDLLRNHRQVILSRRTEDLLHNPKADRLLTELEARAFILFGVGLERSIRRLALSLLARGKTVGFVPEACGYWNEIDAELTTRQLVAKGSSDLTIHDVTCLFKEASKRRIKRVFSKPRPPKIRRSLAS